jgi:hypothetical protein
MIRHSTLLLGLLLGASLASEIQALDSPTLYLRRLSSAQVTAYGLTSQFALFPCITTRLNEQSELIHVRTQREEAYPPFFGLPETEEYVLPSGEARAYLVITTGPDGTMNNCAEVTVDLFRESGGQRVAIASGTVTTTLVPPSAGGTLNPVQVPITIGGSVAARTFAPGESLSAVILIANTCADSSGRNLTLRYDAIDRLGRIEFAAIPAPVPGGPLDPDNDSVFSLCDNCPDTPNPEQDDHNNDGQGDICTECTIGGLNPPSCNCEISPCASADPCILSACDEERGCVVDALRFLEAVQCRLDVIEGAILDASAEDLTPKLARRKGPLRKLIRKDRKAAVKAQLAIDNGRPQRKVNKKVAKVGRILGRFMNTVDDLPGGIAPDLRDTILDNATLAREQLTTSQQ